MVVRYWGDLEKCSLFFTEFLLHWLLLVRAKFKVTDEHVLSLCNYDMIIKSTALTGVTHKRRLFFFFFLLFLYRKSPIKKHM